MASSADLPGVVAPPPIIFGVPLAVALYEDRSRPIPFPMLTPTVGRAVGAILLLIGLVLMFSAVVQFKRAKTAVAPYRASTAIVDGWPYSFTRNPIYVAMTIIYIAIAFAFDTLWPIVLLPLVLIVMQRGVIEREERYLDRRFGDEYRDYKLRVRRWI